jgi:DNA-binding transcriptional LysR family regulator
MAFHKKLVSPNFGSYHFIFWNVEMDRLSAMATLLAAVEGGSLSAASRKLGMPLPTVSRKISELEAHLRTRLIHRTSRRLSLTDAGQAYIVACKRILEDVGEVERAAAGEYSAPRGDLAMTAPIVFGRLHVLPIVTAFLKAHPDINIRMALGDRVVDLQEEHVDLAVRIGDLPDSSLVATRVGAISHVVCGSTGYFETRSTPKNPADLRRHDCITFGGMTSPDRWTFATGKSQVSVPVRSRLIVNTAEAAIDAAIAGVGVTRVLSYQAEAALRTGTLQRVLRRFEPAPMPVSLVHAGQGLLPLKLRAFIDFAAPRLKARLAQN